MSEGFSNTYQIKTDLRVEKVLNNMKKASTKIKHTFKPNVNKRSVILADKLRHSVNTTLRDNDPLVN